MTTPFVYISANYSSATAEDVEYFITKEIDLLS